MSVASLGGCVDVNDVKHFLLRAGEGMKERGLGAQVLVTVRAFCGSPSRLAEKLLGGPPLTRFRPFALRHCVLIVLCWIYSWPFSIVANIIFCHTRMSIFFVPITFTAVSLILIYV